MSSKVGHFPPVHFPPLISGDSKITQDSQKLKLNQQPTSGQSGHLWSFGQSPLTATQSTKMPRDAIKFNSLISFTGLKPAEDRIILFSFLAEHQQSVKKGAANCKWQGFLWQLYVSVTDVCSSLLESRSFCRAHMRIKDFSLGLLTQNIYLLSSGEIERSHGLNIWQLACDATNVSHLPLMSPEI